MGQGIAVPTSWQWATFATRLAAFSLLALQAIAEPLLYIDRPARQDVAIVDARLHRVIGGLPLAQPLRFIAPSPDGSFAYLKMDGEPLKTINTISQAIRELEHHDLPPEILFGASNLVFNKSGTLAYVADDEGGIHEIDTHAHAVNTTVVENFPRIEKMLLSLDENYLLIRTEEDVVALHIDSGVWATTHRSRSKLRDIAQVRDGTLLVLSDREVYFTRYGISYNNYEGLIFEDGEVLALDTIYQTQHANPEQARKIQLNSSSTKLFIGYDHGISALELVCSVSADHNFELIKHHGDCFQFDPNLGTSLPVNPLPPPSGMYLSELPLDQYLQRKNRKTGLEGLTSLVLPPGTGELYALGKRSAAVVNTHDTTLKNAYAIAAGGGSLGSAISTQQVQACTPHATSLHGLISEIKQITTSDDTRSRLLGKANSALNHLQADDLAAARYALKGLINVIVWRSAQAPESADHITPEDASSLSCAAGNLIARIDVY